MPRSTYIYLVHPKDHSELVVAVFTVKCESQEWAENSRYGLENLKRTRMRDGLLSRNEPASTRTLVPWE